MHCSSSLNYKRNLHLNYFLKEPAGHLKQCASDKRKKKENIPSKHFFKYDKYKYNHTFHKILIITCLIKKEQEDDISTLLMSLTVKYKTHHESKTNGQTPGGSG